MATDTKVCLGVAIDHRIRRLCSPLAVVKGDKSDHVEHIKARGKSLGRAQDEIHVTAELAGPPVKGGIAVVLQQPRPKHPFQQGTDAVIDDCETLKALRHVFSVLSLGTLDMKAHICVVDLLPFLSGPVTDLSDADLTESFRTSVQVICDREPEVLVCAGRLWTGKLDKRKAEARNLESLGVGKRFGQSRQLPVITRIRHGDKGLVSISRVNGFHPSHAMNYFPHVSLLRQLLLLIGAEACAAVSRGDVWEDEEWMDVLRQRCQDLPGKPLNAFPSSVPQSPGQSSSTMKTGRFFSDYQELFSDKVLQLQETIGKLIKYGTNETRMKAYEAILQSNLAEKCNDASLLLDEMVRLKRKGWPEKIDWKNRAALNEAAKDTFNFSSDMFEAARDNRESRISDIVEEACYRLNKRVALSADRGKRKVYDLDLSLAGADFLSLAVAVESLLYRLQEEIAAARAATADSLSGLLIDLRLGPVDGVKRIPVGR